MFLPTLLECFLLTFCKSRCASLVLKSFIIHIIINNNQRILLLRGVHLVRVNILINPGVLVSLCLVSESKFNTGIPLSD